MAGVFIGHNLPCGTQPRENFLGIDSGPTTGLWCDPAHLLMGTCRRYPGVRAHAGAMPVYVKTVALEAQL